LKRKINTLEEINYFPIMLDLRGKKVLLVGGGTIAVEKFGRLIGCTREITVVSPECAPEMEEYLSKYSITVHRRLFEDSDLNSVDIVITAVDSQEVQAHIFAEATKRRILCNAVDLPAYCHFIFPSVVRRDSLVVAVSTSGASPAFAKHFRRFLEKLIPGDIGDFLKMMRQKRDSFPKGKERMHMLDKEAAEYVNSLANKTLKG